jgi:predicted phage baseplate assembly protein
MSAPWWGREARGADRPAGLGGQDAGAPVLTGADQAAIAGEVTQRIPAYTSDWTSQRTGDAGVALVSLFAVESEPVMRRVNRLPEKLLSELVDAAGVRALPATAAETILAFTVSATAPASVPVPEGAQATAAPASGTGDRVIFETVEGLDAAPADVAELRVDDGGVNGEVPVPEAGASILPFGRRAGAGQALWIGLDGGPAPGPSLSLGVFVAGAGGAPPPAAAGGVVPLPIAPPPLLRWEVLDGPRFAPAEVEEDGTGSFLRSGVIRLRLPPTWAPSRPQLLGDGDERRWLRVRIVHGAFDAAPRLTGLVCNAVRAAAVRTIRGEVPEPLGTPSAQAQRTMRLSQTPVLRGSVVLDVDEGLQVAGEPGVHRWDEVDDLSDAGAEDRVFMLDSASGVLTFGDGVHGAQVPQGFRNVVARAYRVGGGSAGAVDADAVTTLVTSVPFLSGVTNPVPASGGIDAEPVTAQLARGPQELRARGRAVTTADYEVLARRAPGADVARAHAVAGLHPAHPGRPVPGVVGVFVIPSRREDGPPTPDEGTLEATARFLSEEAAPAGVEIVVAAPSFHRVRVETQVIAVRAADPAAVARTIVAALDTYLDPLVGGDGGRGWPFGGPVRYTPLLQRVLSADPDVRAVPSLAFVIDGVRVPPCEDRAIAPHALVWPDVHQVAVEPERES